MHYLKSLTVYQLYFPAASFEPYPAAVVPLRSGTEQQDTYSVIDIGTQKTLEELPPVRALFTLYEGGIFLHQSLSYLVVHVNHDEQFGRVRRTNVEWVTRQREYKEVDPWKSKQAKIMWRVRNRNRIVDEAFVSENSKLLQRPRSASVVKNTRPEDESDEEIEDEDEVLCETQCIVEDEEIAPLHYKHVDHRRQEIIKTDVMYGEVKGICSPAF